MNIHLDAQNISILHMQESEPSNHATEGLSDLPKVKI